LSPTQDATKKFTDLMLWSIDKHKFNCSAGVAH